MHAWGVIDVLAVTDFPDIRTKCAIQSETAAASCSSRARAGTCSACTSTSARSTPTTDGAVRATTVDADHREGQRRSSPRTPSTSATSPWYSVYEVGHRLTDRFDDVPPDEAGTRTPRVFIAGDACHTHSAKAGQGMNVSMQDGFNLGWKLGHVLDGRSPESLLDTYSAERQAIAQKLIDFDSEWSGLMASKPGELDDPAGARGLLRADRRVPGRVHRPSTRRRW